MRSHLEDDVLLDVIEESASAEATRHAAQCAACASRVAEARAGFALASGADAPEPSPLFWDAFRRRVALDIAAERPARPVEAGSRARRVRLFLAPALLATAATVAVLSFVPRDQGPVAVSPSPMAAATAIPGFDDGVDAAAAAIDDLGCSDVAACVVSLTDEESRALADALRADLAESGDL